MGWLFISFTFCSAQKETTKHLERYFINSKEVSKEIYTDSLKELTFHSFAITCKETRNGGVVSSRFVDKKNRIFLEILISDVYSTYKLDSTVETLEDYESYYLIGKKVDKQVFDEFFKSLFIYLDDIIESFNEKTIHYYAKDSNNIKYLVQYIKQGSITTSEICLLEQ